MDARVIGMAGWSGSGKTTLLVKLIPILTARGLKISTLKHAHHEFDTDLPGKDSYEHRQAGAGEVIISSSRRWVQVHELGDEAELTLPRLLRRLSPCDLVLVEGFKRYGFPKLEVYRSVVGKPALHARDADILAVASDRPLPDAKVPVVDLNDVAAIADLVYTCAEPLESVLTRLQDAGADGSAF